MTTTKATNRFSSSFKSHVCAGDTIEAHIDGFDVQARIESDSDHHIDDDDCHSKDQSVTGCNDEQYEKLLSARKAWFADEWFYCGVVLRVQKAGVTLVDYVGCWGIDANYPDGSNEYLTETANDYINEAISRAQSKIAELTE